MSAAGTITRVAMWSGPRNISTAMMRAWGNRPDTVVCDEPLYAHYLRVTGLEHPGREEVLASQPNDWESVVEWLTGPIPGGRPIFFQKHMAHHLLPNIDRAWLDRLDNAFLIRDPREMLTSLVRITPDITVADTGLPQQTEIFDGIVARTGTHPPVIDAKDVLDDPERLLRALCGSLGVSFDDAMLSWAAGPRDYDGVWAPYWYKSVEQSVGWRPYTPKADPVPERLADVYEECRQHYDRLYAHRLTG